ncbi:ANTAR domain-containing protein [Streptomyces sp. NPDC101209]|uniref:ANTAR domain-containing protein n=1 Tax=Streptomyces sp. NPDC101209 TaxID=3366129 RepID=UPI00382DE8FA
MTDTPSMPSAPSGGARPAPEDGVREAEEDVVGQRNRRLAQAGVARAEELLMSRYGISSRQEAFDLLRRTSQRFNIKLHVLADVAVRLPAPQMQAPHWAPSRPRRPEPPVPALRAGGPARSGYGAVLKTALERTLHLTGAEMGNVQVVESGVLRMERHAGLDRSFTDYFAFVASSTTSCAQAAEEVRQVTVKDVEASDIFDEGSRQTILDAGSQACHSVPLLGPNGAVRGMISSHHARPLNDLSPDRLGALHELGRQVGLWLSWHRGTVVPAALDHLHRTVTGRR